MAYAKVKPEMKGATSRWNRREWQKESARVVRRKTDTTEVEDGESEESRREIRAYIDGCDSFDDAFPIDSAAPCPDCGTEVHYDLVHADDVLCIRCGARLKEHRVNYWIGDEVITAWELRKR